MKGIFKKGDRAAYYPDNTSSLNWLYFKGEKGTIVEDNPNEHVVLIRFDNFSPNGSRKCILLRRYIKPLRPLSHPLTKIFK